MRFNLNLKGNELLIFAIIHGFSQDGESEFHGSLQYLAEWTGATKQGVIKNLKSLQEKGYIYKREIHKGSMKFCTYSANVSEFNTIKQSLIPHSTEFNSTVKLSLPNNIDNTIVDNIDNPIKKHTKFIPPTLEEVQQYIDERKSPIDAKYFIDFFSIRDWHDSNGKPVRCWKQKLITWEMREKKNKSSCRDSSVPVERQSDWSDTREIFEQYYREKEANNDYEKEGM